MQHIQSEVAAGPRFEDFLQAQIGLAKDGMPISVRTAMARQGLDPAGEADRIARLPRGLALNALAILIHKVVEGTWQESEVRGKAESLTRLLPGAAPPTDTTQPADRRPRMILLLAMLLLVVVTISIWPGSWMAALAGRIAAWL